MFSTLWASEKRAGKICYKRGAIDPRNLSIEFSLQYHMSDPCTKFEEDWIKIVVAIVDEILCEQTDKHKNLLNFQSTAMPIVFVHLAESGRWFERHVSPALIT